MTVSLNDGTHRLRNFSVLKSLSSLPKMTGEDHDMLMQWFPAMLQQGDGILSEGCSLVIVSCFYARDCSSLC